MQTLEMTVLGKKTFKDSLLKEEKSHIQMKTMFYD